MRLLFFWWNCWRFYEAKEALVGLVLWANLRENKVLLLRKTNVLDKNQFGHCEFELTMHAEVRVTIASFHGPTVDLFFADKQNFDELQKVMAGTLPFAKLDFDYFKYLSRPN